MSLGKILLQTAAGVLATSAIACFMKSARNNESTPVMSNDAKTSSYRNSDSSKAQYTDNASDSVLHDKRDKDL